MKNLKSFFCIVLSFLGMMFTAAQVKKQHQKEQNKSKSVSTKEESFSSESFAVAPFKDTLFLIHHRVGSISSQDRAKLISDRIKTLSNNDFFVADSLKVKTSEIGSDILYNQNFVVMSVTAPDTLNSSLSIDSLAFQNLKIIKNAIVQERLENSTPNLLKRIGLTFLVVFFILLILYLVNKGFVTATNTLVAKNPGFFKGFKIKNIEVLSPARQEYLAKRAVTVVKLLLSFLIVYFSLPILFSFFPSTKGYADTLLNWVLTPAKSVFMGFVGFLPNLFSIVVIVFIFRYAIKVLKFFVDEIRRENIHIDGFYSDWALPTFNIVRVLLYAFMIVIIFPYLPGSDSPIFQGVSVFIGILFSLGSSNAIANMVAGLVITYMRPFKIGDFIKIGEVSGEVIEKTALVTRVRTTKFEEVTIPNSTVLSSTSTNYSANTKDSIGGLVVHTTVTIGYDAPWTTVHKALIEAAYRTDFIQKLPEPFVLQTSLDDFYVAYQINAYTREPNKQPRIYSSLHQNIQDTFNEVGIEIMSPHYIATRDGNKTTIPTEYLRKK